MLPPAHCPSILSSRHLVVSRKRKKATNLYKARNHEETSSSRTTPILPWHRRYDAAQDIICPSVSGTSSRACHGANARRSHRSKVPRCVSGLNGLGVTQRSQPSGRGGRRSRGLFVSHGICASLAAGGWFVPVLLGRAVEVHACMRRRCYGFWSGRSGLLLSRVCVLVWVLHVHWLGARGIGFKVKSTRGA